MDVLATIRALRSRTEDNGCSEAEAIAAVAKVAHLLDKHGFSLSDLDYENEQIKTSHIDMGGKLSSLAHVAAATASYCDCRWWTNHSRGGKEGRKVKIKFFGKQSDCETALYLMCLFDSSRKYEWEKYKKTETARRADSALDFHPDLRIEKRNFEIGMMHRISERLYVLKRDRNRYYDIASGKTGYDLVVRKDNAVSLAYDKLGLQLSTRKSSPPPAFFSNAYRKGQDAGSRVAISTGVGASVQAKIR